MIDDTANPISRHTQSEYIIQVPDERMQVGETRTYPPVFRRDYYNVSEPLHRSLSFPDLFINPDPKVDCGNDKGITPPIQHRRRNGCIHRDLESPTHPTSPFTRNDGGGRSRVARHRRGYPIQTRGVKVRDFAYAPPYARPAAPLVPVTTYTTTTETLRTQIQERIFTRYT